VRNPATVAQFFSLVSCSHLLHGLPLLSNTIRPQQIRLAYKNRQPFRRGFIKGASLAPIIADRGEKRKKKTGIP
jgi:hypothetical protein